MYTRWASLPPSAWRSWAAMMLAGSLLAAIADANAWRSMCGWGNQPDAGGEAGEGAAGVVGVDRRAPLGAEHQVQLDRLGRPAGFDPSQRDCLGLPAGETPAGLLAAVLAECLHSERRQGEDGAAGGGLDRPHHQLLAPAA